jgi:ABC-type multidrug transport system fused ATPase/permease subunit
MPYCSLQVVETGTYKDLMAKPNGTFRRLVEQQAYVLHD